MKRKFKISEDVICNGQVGDMTLYNEGGRITGYNTIGNYYVKFGTTNYSLANSGYILELGEYQIRKKSKEPTGYDRMGGDISKKRTIYEYDNFGRVIVRTEPNGDVEKFGYDEYGNMVAKNDVILVPSGEVLSLSINRFKDYVIKNIVKWDGEYNCYIIPDTLKNSLQ